MASLKQIEANRLNARKSTGPITSEGKDRSRCNAIRHGLTAETVVSALEDADDYKTFEAAIVADCRPRGPLEHELVLRLASLLWRLRRVLAMETGLFDIQADQMQWSVQKCRSAEAASATSDATTFPLAIDAGTSDSTQPLSVRAHHGVDLARCFLRLANLPNFALDRLSRYETMLSRQVTQVLFALNDLHRRDR